MPNDQVEILEEGTVSAVVTVVGDTDTIELQITPTVVTLSLPIDETVQIFETGPQVYLGSGENIPFTQQGPLAVGIGTTAYPISGGTFTILSIAARVTGASAGSSVIVDVNKNGVSIFGTQSNRPTIAAGSYNATVGAYSVIQVTDGDYLSVDIDQVGSTSSGAHLVLVIRLQRNP